MFMVHYEDVFPQVGGLPIYREYSIPKIRYKHDEKIIRIGGVDLWESEAAENIGNYIVKYNRVYKICFDEARGFYSELVKRYEPINGIGLMPCGVFQIIQPEQLEDCLRSAY